MAFMAACGGDDLATPTWAGTRDTIAGVEVVRNPGEPLDTLMAAGLRELWRATDTGSEGVWEDPRRLALGHGCVYVLDAQAHRVYVIDADTGDDLGSFGREGGGPGEFERPFGIAVLGDRVVVGNGNGPRIDLFRVTGGDSDDPGTVTYGRSIRIDFLPFRLEALPGGRLLLSGMLGRGPVTRLMALDGSIEPYEPPDTSVTDPEVSFDDCGSSDATSTGPVRGCGKRFAFQELTLDGQVVREVFVDRPPVLATQAELDSLEAMMWKSFAEVGMSDKQEERLLERMLGSMRVKTVYGPFRADSTTGRLYVLDNTLPERDDVVASLQIFDADRRYVARVPISEDWGRFEVSGGRIYALVRDPGTGLVTLVAYGVEVPSGGS